MNTVVCVARDAAPSRTFMKLEKTLQETGLFNVKLFVGDGKPITNSIEEIAGAVSNANLVLLGMSSSPELASPEILAGMWAMKHRIHYGFYGDIRRCWGRARQGAWFESLSEGAAFYLGVTQVDADAARKVFPNARLIGTGNPLREEMAFPKYSRDEVRAKLGVTPDNVVVLAAGGKLCAGNMASWAILMDALVLTNKPLDLFQLILSTHPGDRTPFAIDKETQKDLRLYNELAQFSPVATRVVSKDEIATSDLVPGADVIVEFGSSIGIEGAYQQVPVITIGFEILFRRNENIGGSRSLESVDGGLSDLVGPDAIALARKIQELLTLEGYSSMRQQQMETCVKPTERGAALKRMATAIKEFALERAV